MRRRRNGLDSIGPPGSRLLHSIDQLSSRPMVAWVLLSAAMLWVAFSVATGFPARVETIFQTLVAAVTLALVFVIQHTQAREQLVTQRKLDEILQALPDADNAVVSLEEPPTPNSPPSMPTTATGVWKPPAPPKRCRTDRRTRSGGDPICTTKSGLARPVMLAWWRSKWMASWGGFPYAAG